MKMKYFILTFFLLFPIILNAQLISEWGVIGGYTSSNINTDKFDDISKRRSGFIAGVYSGFLNNPLFSITVQIQYSQKGFTEEIIETNDFGEPIQTVKANSRLDYLSIPILVNLKYSNPLITPYLVTGPRLDYLITKKNGKYKFTNITLESEWVNNFSDFVIGGTVGAGIKLPWISKINFAFEFVYNFDLTDSYSKIETLEVKNNSYDFLLKIGL
jgi:hypothetical protein